MTFKWPSWVDPLPFPFPELHNNDIHFSLLCPLCRSPNTGSWDVSKGLYTVISLNRTDWDVAGNSICQTKLSEVTNRHTASGSKVCGELVATVNHKGSHHQKKVFQIWSELWSFIVCVWQLALTACSDSLLWQHHGPELGPHAALVPDTLLGSGNAASFYWKFKKL